MLPSIGGYAEPLARELLLDAAARLGLPRPAWLPQDLYEKLLFKGEGEGGGEGAAAERVHASDLAMAGVAARAGRLA